MAELVVAPTHRGRDAGSLTLCRGRLTSGEPVGFAFTSPTCLCKVMGTGQSWIPITVTAMKALLAPLGIARIQLNPVAVTWTSAHPPGTTAKAPRTSGQHAAPATDTTAADDA